MRLPIFPPGSPVRVLVTNLYDLLQAQNGTLPERDVRNLAFHRAEIDLRVLSLEIPTRLIDCLGLTADPEGTNRLSPVRAMIHGQQATIQPFRGSGELLVIGHITLTALGLMLDKDGDLVDDPFPQRFGPLDAV
jgi:hypothetical protein